MRNIRIREAFTQMDKEERREAMWDYAEGLIGFGGLIAVSFMLAVIGG